MKQYFGNLILALVLFSLLMVHPTSQTFADYVLPYPSYIPGNRLYGLSLALDRLEAFWYWGNIAAVKYHLKLADKYLVEARTLFEYGQYLLAVQALSRSDLQFKLVPQYLEKANREGKDISKLKELLDGATVKHASVLVKLKSEVPSEVVWTPENVKPTKLNLRQILDGSINIRHGIL